MSADSTEAEKKYRVLQPPGFTEEEPFFLSYKGRDGKDKRAYQGEVVDDIPARSVSWLTGGGYIEEVTGKQDKADKADKAGGGKASK